MFRERTTLLAATLMMMSAIWAPAAAQSRQSDLISLATVFGELHYVRRMCAPRRESDLWRERMKQLVAYEQPTARFRRRLVQGFNQGYRTAQNAYATCTDDAEEYSETRADAGQAIVTRLLR